PAPRGAGACGTEAHDNMPGVILNNDPSQKFVRAELAGEQDSREVLMLVDTGAQITLIDQSLAEELALERLDNALLTGVTGSAVGWIGRLPVLRLGRAEVRDLSVMVGPMRGRLLLGMDVLERLELSVGPRSLQRARPETPPGANPRRFTTPVSLPRRRAGARVPTSPAGGRA